jgi:O-antigen/teichoic acid export membrane protein
MEFNNIINISVGTARQIGTILIIGFTGNLLYVVYWYAASYGILIVAYMASVTHFFTYEALVPGFSSFVVKKNFAFTSKLTLNTIFGGIQQHIDMIIISKLLPIGIFGYYGFAKRLISYGGSVGTSIWSAVFPSFSKLSGLGNERALQTQFIKVYDLISFGTVPIFALVIYALMPVSSFVFDPEVANLIFLPAVFLCLGSYMYGMVGIPLAISIAVGKSEIPMKTSFYALLCIAPLSIFLIYSYGLVGAGFAYIARMLFCYVYAIPRICSGCLGLRTSNIYRHDLRILFLVSLTYGLAWSALSAVDDFSNLALCIAYLTATIAYLFGSYRVMSAGLKEAILRYLQGLRFRVSGVS